MPNKIAIRYGLYSLARENPLIGLRPDEVRALVRRSLYRHDGETLIDETRLEQAAERFVLTLERYADLEPAEFNHLFVSNAASWLKNAANRKRCPGGVMPVKIMRQATLEWVWRILAHGRLLDHVHQVALGGNAQGPFGT